MGNERCEMGNEIARSERRDRNGELKLEIMKSNIVNLKSNIVNKN